MKHSAISKLTISGSGAATVGDFRLREHVVLTDCERVRAIVEGTGFFRPDEVAVAVDLVEERLARGAKSGYSFVFAELDEELVGYACYGQVACTLSSFELYWIAVKPEYQRAGLGRMLMGEVERLTAASGGERIYIDTSGKSQYTPTRKFYERVGYVVAAQLKDFYAPGDDRVTYVKALNTRGPTLTIALG